MPWDRKRLLGYVETIQLILGLTEKMDIFDLLFVQNKDYQYSVRHLELNTSQH